MPKYLHGKGWTSYINEGIPQIYADKEVDLENWYTLRIAPGPLFCTLGDRIASEHLNVVLLVFRVEVHKLG